VPTLAPSASHAYAGPAPVELVAHRTEFRILGPLEVVDRGAGVPIRGQKKRALLARLLLDANRVVPVDGLVDALWGDEVPATAVKMVHIYVSQLRKVLPSGMLHTRPPGYVIEVAPEAVDRLRFDRLRAEARAAAAEGDPATAAARLRSALSLWRGHALAEFSEPFAVVEAAHLEELRLAAIEDRIDADLALGQHGDVIGELQVLVAGEALRERLRRQLMLALYRAGRHAEALAAYDQYRRELGEQLGIEPSAPLAELQYRILNQDPDLDVDPPAARAVPRPASAPPAPANGFVGRAAELEGLQSAFEAAAAGRGTTALITGPAGIGKTRLASELAERAGAAGATVLTGRCIDLVGAALPYLPFVEALRPLRGSPALDGLGELSRLLPGPRDSAGTAGADRDAGESQLRLFEQVLAALDRLSAEGPVVLVLEDLHWADGSTLDLCAFLAHAVRERPVLIVASFRWDAMRPDAPVHRLATGLQRAGLALTVELGPLTRDELAALVARGGESLSDELVANVCARGEGNPFYAQELLAAALRGDDSLPRLLRDVLAADLARLETSSMSVVRVAAAAGRAVPLRLLTAAIRLPEQEIVAALRHAVDHAVLVPDPVAGTYRFRHALIAEAAYATLLPGEREGVHERLARALSNEPALSASGATAGELAEHWIAAGRPMQALTASLQAARDAQAVSGLGEALRHLERVLDLWDQVPRAAEVTGVAMPAVLAWATEIAGALVCCDGEIDARSFAAVLGAGDAPDAASVAARTGMTTEAAAATLRGLACDGLLEPAGDGRFRPARLAMTEARELYPLVVVLESLAIRRLPPIDPAALDALRRANERMRAALNDPSAAIVADDDFHTHLTAGCVNEPLLAALRPVKRALLRYEQVYMLEPERVARSVAQHEGIIAALARGDHTEAAQRLRRNLTGGLPDLTPALEH
jgi:DNA-binding SARP family transcriptional activator/DNA-binding GntR family transcriptional regulator